jgi:hypothetical protein
MEILEIMDFTIHFEPSSLWAIGLATVLALLVSKIRGF